MDRFEWRGWSWLSFINSFLAVFFNKLLVRCEHYRDEKTDILEKVTWKLVNRLDYPGEI